jgi:hypothetical protein
MLKQENVNSHRRCAIQTWRNCKFQCTIDIPKGPGIDAIEVYRTYVELDEDGEIASVKPAVLDQTINIGSANETGLVSKAITYDYAKLTSGLNMPLMKVFL